MADVTIIGGGIMGMLSARELLAQGYQVRLLERQALGSEASWAGGGIVSPLYPWRYDAAITRLASWAQDVYPHLVRLLHQETGIDAEYSPCGLYFLDADEHNQALAWARNHHRAIETPGMSQVYQAEPALAQRYQTALKLPSIGHVRNPRLLRALKESLRQHPRCELHEHQSVLEWTVKASRVIEVVTADKRWTVDQVLLAAGAWSGLLSQKLGADLPVEPVKGQMMVFEPRPGLLNSMVMAEGRYLIPRQDGRILVGSTLEYTGFDTAVSQQAKDELLTAACSMLPALGEVPVERHWAGLRPGSPRGMPFIGRWPDLDNLFVNAGHFRNGLVLAPASARLITDIIVNQTPILDPMPYAVTHVRAGVDPTSVP